MQGVVSEAKAEGLWFLKHSTMDRNEGVMCFKGAMRMEIFWGMDCVKMARVFRCFPQ